MDSRTKKKRTHKRSYENCFEIFLNRNANLQSRTGENQVKELERLVCFM